MEALVAMTIIMVGLLGIFSLLSRSLSLNRVVADRYVASYLAAEGIELVKNKIDNNVINRRAWNTGITNGDFEIDAYGNLALNPISGNQAALLRFDNNRGSYAYAGDQTTRFRRKINIRLLGGGDELKVTAIVSWLGRGEADFEVALEDRFFNYWQ
jgi:hypothetical protein